MSDSIPELDDLEGPEQQLANKLFSDGVLTAAELIAVAQERRQTGQPLHFILSHAVPDPKVIGKALAELLQAEFVDLETLQVDPEVVRKIPEHVGFRSSSVPIRITGNSLTLAMADPFNLPAIDDVALLTGLDVKVAVATSAGVRRILEMTFGENRENPGAADRLMEDLDTIGREPIPDEESEPIDELGENDDPLVRLVNLILNQAVQNRVTEVLIEPSSTSLVVRYRIGGQLQVAMNPPLICASALARRLKVMAQWRFNEPAWAQQSRINIRINGKEYFLRMTVTPTIAGESIHLRIFDRMAHTPLSLESLGLPDEAATELVRRALLEPGGELIMVSGPRSSGKTSTMYALLSVLRSRSRKIMTVEEEFESHLAEIEQIECKPSQGWTMSRVIRSCLHHGPDVLMVGEIRSRAVLRLVLRAVLDGCKVIAGLTAPDIGHALAQLSSGGASRLDLALCLRLVIQQRLIHPGDCESCREPLNPTDALLASCGLPTVSLARIEQEFPDRSLWKLFRRRGCDRCQSRSFGEGSRPLFEIMPIGGSIASALEAGTSPVGLYRLWHQMGGTTMLEQALREAILGRFPLEVVHRLRATLGSTARLEEPLPEG